MDLIEREIIDWSKTGKRLRTLRERNLSLIRYTCFVCHYKEENCDGKCESCDFDKDLDRSITRDELAKVFGVTATIINNWEMGNTPVPLDDLLFYCQIAKQELREIIVFA